MYIKMSNLFALLVLADFAFADIDTPRPSSAKQEIFNQYLKDVIVDFLKPSDPTIEYLESLNPRGITILFHGISPPYKIEYRRLKQINPDEYLPAPEQEFVLNTVNGDGVARDCGIFLPYHDFLPGERVFWRFLTQDGQVLKTACCCPRPLYLKNKDNKLLAEAVLVSANRPTTVYTIWFPSRQKGFELEFKCGEKTSSIKVPAGGRTYTTFEPRERDTTGGFASISILQDEELTSLQVPWGSKLEKFNNRFSTL